MATQNTMPLAELVALQRDVERLLARFGAPTRRLPGEWKPPMDVYVDAGEVVIRLEAPGMRLEELQVTVTGGVVTLRGGVERDRYAPPERYAVRESAWGEFERRVSLPEGVDPSKVRAAYRDGVLEVRLPDESARRARRVPVVAAGRSERPAARPGSAATAGPDQRPRPHLFHGSAEAADNPDLGGPATGPHGTGDEHLPGEPEAHLQPPGEELRYAPRHLPSQEEWLGRTSSGEESLEKAAEEQAEAGVPPAAPKATRGRAETPAGGEVEGRRRWRLFRR
ncbi:MAG: Hsp20/alpha crystallin family protein [Coriobacteriia bacterium]|nr:Hsp20/alpha crystallin family protein [Coriobacteriia bacterium]